MNKKLTKEKIFVTKPFLAPIEEYFDMLHKIWDSGILTNDGFYVNELERSMSAKLGLSNFISFSSGTTSIQAAIRALDLKGEIITTSFTWIATVSAIKMENCTPIFCDVDENTLNIDTTKIENLINKNTVAIMPVHVFGSPVDIKAIKKIADKYDLKIIYDSAHAIGSKFEGKSVLEFGDISATSLHATKLVNSGEGGGCITPHKDVSDKLKSIRFFGHNEEKTDILHDGMNGKISEIQAALGLANFKYIDLILKDRKEKYDYYYNGLKSISSLRFQQHKFGETNYSYFPIIFEREKDLHKIIRLLNQNQIFPRRYFYPSVNTFEKVIKYAPTDISERISNNILCLPLYFDLDESIIQFIISIIRSEL